MFELMERLSGQAWLATETLPLTELKDTKGVDNWLRHLWQELVRTFEIPESVHDSSGVLQIVPKGSRARVREL